MGWGWVVSEAFLGWMFAEHPSYSDVVCIVLSLRYSNKDGFAADIRLIFDNCQIYNEDDSEVGFYSV